MANRAATISASAVVAAHGDSIDAAGIDDNAKTPMRRQLLTGGI